MALLSGLVLVEKNLDGTKRLFSREHTQLAHTPHQHNLFSTMLGTMLGTLYRTQREDLIDWSKRERWQQIELVKWLEYFDGIWH